MTKFSARWQRWFLMGLLLVGAFVLLGLAAAAMSVRSVFANGDLMQDVWFQVTLLDAYLGFLIFYAWVAWKESSVAARIVWFVLIMCLGNVATCGYLLLQLKRLPAERPASDILNRKSRESSVSI